MDILSGSYSGDGLDEMAGLFQVLWGKGEGKFSAPEALKGKDGKLLIVKDKEDTRRICTRPTAVDWDGDGDLDLIVGNFEGSFFLFKGEGKGVFYNDGELLAHEGAALKIESYHSDPYCVDIDGDGDLDVLSGSADGGVQVAKNEAAKGISINKFSWLIKGSGVNTVWAGEESSGPASSTRVYADDVDNDGKLDLLVGDQVSVCTPAKGVDEKLAKSKFDEMNALMSEFSKARESGEGDMKALMEKYNKLRGELPKYVETKRTGHVWLYRGK